MNPRALRFAGPAILAGAGLIALLLGLAYGGGATPLVIGDPGPVVRWVLPVTELTVNLSAAVLVGSLVLALFSLVAGSKEFDFALDAASAGAAILTVASGVTGYLTFLKVIPARPSADAAFGEQLGRFLVDTDPGRAWLMTTVAGAVLTVLAFAVRGWLPTLLVAVLAIAAMVPMATAGHTGSEANHNIAVTSLALHIIAAAAWLGGLLLLILLRPLLTRDRLTDVLQRYSSIALAAFVVVTLSGIARAAIGILSFQNLFSAYGAILIVKVVALLAMGVLGAVYRRRLIAGIRDTAVAARFWTLVLLEVVFMGIASGAAVALSLTPPPVDTTLPLDRTPAEVLTGSALPPELTIDRFFTAWDVDLIWAFAVGFGLFFYLAGVRRLARRGDRWPVGRTVLWITGLVLLFYVTCGPVNAYQDYLFSMHMVGHMLLSMAIPMCLVFGAPITLASRAIRKRDDGTRGGREWILWAIHSPYAKVITHPLVAAALFIVSLWAFYYTDIFRWTLYDHLGHEWMVLHFLTVGYLFVMSLVGIDPIPYRLPHAGRLLTLIGVMAMHAFFGISIMMSSGLFVAEWFGSMARPWGLDPLADQYMGGGIAWSIGEIPTLILAIVVAVQWSRSDERRQRSSDRQADRSGDAELEAYNARLAEIAARDERDARREAAR